MLRPAGGWSLRQQGWLRSASEAAQALRAPFGSALPREPGSPRCVVPCADLGLADLYGARRPGAALYATEPQPNR